MFKKYWPVAALIGAILGALALVFLISSDSSRSTQAGPSTIKNTVSVSTTVPLPSLLSSGSNICIHIGNVDQSWPVGEAVVAWNKNNKNLFSIVDSETVKSQKCDGFVVLHAENTSEYWGSTIHTGTRNVILGVSNKVPTEHRLHVLCHELGHVLGLPHLPNIVPNLKSCMNIGSPSVQLYNPEPSTEDLKTVSQDLWDWDKARQSSHR